MQIPLSADFKKKLRQASYNIDHPKTFLFHNLLRGLRLRGPLVFYKKFLDN
jgi:hypothetical protein